ncbi:colicin E3/pyocin S6 family cytotoxin [Streptomyces sp. NPDC002602]|uniref:colicin E3/pyocin S6 family cytotoxin n=1 Tax=Streptomyces sp. NPDC002602 TaxID=3364654 RepID=UPI0036B494D0
MPDGRILEWDSAHGTIEMWTNGKKNAKHVGEFDPNSGNQLPGNKGKPVPGRKLGGMMTGWVIEEFERDSGTFRRRHGLAELSDDDARSLLGLADLGSADLYDISEASLAELSLRFGLAVFPKECEYLLGREF